MPTVLSEAPGAVDYFDGSKALTLHKKTVRIGWPTRAKRLTASSLRQLEPVALPIALDSLLNSRSIERLVNLFDFWFTLALFDRSGLDRVFVTFFGCGSGIALPGLTRCVDESALDPLGRAGSP
jgi:hypothetical protein